MEKRGKGDERGKTEVKEGGKETLTALVWDEKNEFYFKHLLKLIEGTDVTSQLPISRLKAVAPLNTVRDTNKPTHTKV